MYSSCLEELGSFQKILAVEPHLGDGLANSRAFSPCLEASGAPGLFWGNLESSHIDWPVVGRALSGSFERVPADGPIGTSIAAGAPSACWATSSL